MKQFAFPIIKRELVTFLRTRRSFLALLLYLIALSSIVGITWWSASTARNQINRDLLSRTLFHTVCITQLIAFSLFSVLFASTKINSERSRNTLDMLASLPFSTLHIILSKYVSSLVVILLLTIASVPALSLSFLFGGISAREVLLAYSLIIAAVLSFSMVGIACSAVFKKSHTAIIAAVSVILLSYIGFALIAVLLSEILDDFGVSVARSNSIFYCTFVITSPVAAYVAYAMSNPPPISPGIRTYLSYLHFGFMLLLFIAAFAIAVSSFNSAVRARLPLLLRLCRIGRRRAKPFAKPKREHRHLAFARAPKHRPIPDSVNPVFVKDSHTLFPGKLRSRAVRLAVFVFLFLLATSTIHYSIGESYKFDESMTFFGCFSVLAAGLLFPALAARSIASELETNTFPLLISTMLTPRQIILGKLAAIARHIYPMVLIFSAFMIIFFSLEYGVDLTTLFRDMLKIIVPFSAIALFIISIGLLSSAICRRTFAAVLLSYGMLFSLFTSPILALIILSALNVPFFNISFHPIATSIAPIVSPWLYYVPLEEVNLWYQNHKWGNILSYSIIVLGISAAIVTIAGVILSRKVLPAAEPKHRVK